MANDGNFLTLESGRYKRELAINTSAGAGDASKLIRLDASGKIAANMMPSGVGADIVTVASSENLAAGDLVNIWNDAGTAKARKADATTSGKEAVGFVPAAVTSPANADVYLDGQITGLSGLTPGARQYLHTTAGARTETPPNASGNVMQFVGIAYSATAYTFEPEDGVVL